MKRSLTVAPHYYISNDPNTLAHGLFLSALMLGGVPVLFISIGFDLFQPIFMIPWILLLILLGTWLVSLIQIIEISKDGISLHAPLKKKKVIFWKDVCCSGFFYHYTYINAKRKFFYFSTRPLPGGVNYLNLTTMAKPTDTFLYVAQQRDVEAVIKQFYPRFTQM